MEARGLYQHRNQSVAPPAGAWSYVNDERVYQLEFHYHLQPGWSAEVGGLYDRIGVGRAGVQPTFSYGSPIV